MARRLSQAELASAIGATQREISHYETGKTFPKVGRLDELAGVLGVAVRDLMQDIGAASDTMSAAMATLERISEERPERLALAVAILRCLLS